MNRIQASIISAALTAGMAGCSTTPERHSAVEELRSEYESLASQSHVQQNAARQLDHAGDAVARAEAAAREGADEDTINHYIYVADRRMDIVEEASKLARAEEIVQNAEAQRQDVLADRDAAQADRAQADMDGLRSQRQAQRLEENLDELENTLQSLQAEQRDENIVLTLEDTLFATGGATLLPGADNTLDEIADFLTRYDDHNLEIRGHSDSSGSPTENQMLSERRAQVVQNALVERGIDRSRVSAEGYGADDPVATNQTVTGREQNRRVEIVVESAARDRVSTR